MNAKELKLNDVMCGDWVDVRNNANPNTPHIEKITPSHLLREEHWYGIELTPEILEKNDFKRNLIWHHCDKELDNYSISVQLGYANKIDNIKISEKGKDICIPSERTKLYFTHIKYVHELQHALKLCGIDKTIEL